MENISFVFSSVVTGIDNHILTPKSFNWIVDGKLLGLQTVACVMHYQIQGLFINSDNGFESSAVHMLDYSHSLRHCKTAPTTSGANVAPNF